MGRANIPDIPRDLLPDELIQVLNDRIRLIEDALSAEVLTLPLDVQNTRITTVADPQQAQDALNLRSADRRYQAIGASAAAAAKTPPTAPVAVSSSNAGISSFSDTHANRLATYPATQVLAGSFFVETDRGSVYQAQLIASVMQWVFVAGIMQDLATNRPTDLGPLDALFVFYGTDSLAAYRWSGSAWLPMFSSGVVQRITVGHSAIAQPITPVAAAAPNQRLTIFLTNDVIGGGKISWDPSLIGPTTRDIDTRAGLRNAYDFVGLDDGTWQLISMLLGK
jgi:hypothetical protein